MRGGLTNGMFSCEVTFAGLSSEVIEILLRGPGVDPAGGEALVALALDGVTGSSGRATGMLACGSAEMSELVNGLWTVEIRTVDHPSGEVRGRIQPGVNQPPRVGFLGAQRAEVGQALTVPIEVIDPETASADLEVEVSASNGFLIPPGSIVMGGSGAARTATFTPRSDQTGVSTITVKVRDPEGAVAATVFSLDVVRSDYRYADPGLGWVEITAPASGATVTGTIDWSVRARRAGVPPSDLPALQGRGCTQEQIDQGMCGIGAIYLFVDGKLAGIHFGADVATTLDTSRLSGGRHELVASAWAFPDFGQLVGVTVSTIEVGNGDSPVALRPSWHELHLAVGGSEQITHRTVLANGDEGPVAGGLTYSSEDAGVATVDVTGRVTAVGAGIARIVAESGGFRAATRVFAGGPQGFPHFGRDGSMLSEYESGRSLFVRTLFTSGPQELESTFGLATHMRRAGVNTLTCGFFFGAFAGHPDFESWRGGFDFAWGQMERSAACGRLG